MKIGTLPTALRGPGHRSGRWLIRVLATAVLATALPLFAATEAQAGRHVVTSFGVADWDGDGHPDIIARDYNTGYLWLHPGDGRRGYSAETRVRIGNGWSGFTSFGIADWDGDGHQDIVARDDATGDLWLYPGQSRRGYSTQAPVKIGYAWGLFTPFGVTDWDGDGHQDLVFRNDSTGDLWLYPGESRRVSSSQAMVKIGNGWGGYTPFGVADWDRDGHQDVIAEDAAGYLWLYPGESKRGYSGQTRVRIGNGWTWYDCFGIADWDGDGHQDILARYYTTLDLWLYPGQSKRGYSGQAPVRIGDNWY
ncbi:FG-GAP repeat domain-containing protein [Streptomyces sp. NPDC091292]|uniref:FG-GAP repeat domain-containing protein n=1 Tax=Streptomyces sp. NPDC091292 TaxID=3365991 RepID=UPI003825D79B